MRSAVLHGEGSAALLFALDGSRALAAVPDPQHHPGASALLADAAAVLALVLRAEEAERREERAELAESRAREAVLHLLMNGRLSTAHQIAEALCPSLPEPMRMYVVECRAGERGEVARLCEELTGGRAWIVRCPVYVRHLIVLVPGDLAATAAAHDPLAEALAAVARDCTVGVSAELRLREAPAAYTQAFHALAVARGRGGRHARFGPGPELELAAHVAGTGWAEALLAPLHTYVPRRPQDPGPQELRATAHAWLNFCSHATRLLKIHRNTLATRLRLIESVLGVDLARLPEQAALSLALRLTPGGAGGGAGASTGGAAGVSPAARPALRPIWTAYCATPTWRPGPARIWRRWPGGTPRPAPGRPYGPGCATTRTWSRRRPRSAFRCRARASGWPGSRRCWSARCCARRAPATTCGWLTGPRNWPGSRHDTAPIRGKVHEICTIMPG